MHTRKLLPLLPLVAALVTLAVPGTASADFEHVIAPGESLSSVAAADGMSVSQLAAANGVSPDSQLTAGAQLAIPPQSGEAAPAESGETAPAASGETAPAASGETAPAESGETAPAASGETAPAEGGGYQVQPGDTLSAIAARYGTSVSQLAAENGLSPSGLLLAGSNISVGGSSASSGSQPVSDTSSTAAAAPATESSAGAQPAAASGGGGYQVQPGDTLSAIAARYGTSVSQLAAENGLSPSGLLLAGSNISVGGSSASSGSQPVSDTSSTAAAAPATDSTAGAQPTPETVSPSYVGSVAAENGVSPSLAEAIANQESGFNNNEVSNTGATGVMQIEPGTWSNINQVASPPLSPTSASDNVRGGVLLLHSLLDQTGGDPAMAAAAYYQGLGSVRAHGLYSDTQQYVNDVMAERQRFGGP